MSHDHRPQQAFIRAILKDEELTYAARCAAIELYYHTQWETGRLKAAGRVAAHLRNDLNMSRNTSNQITKLLTEQGYIDGERFNPDPKSGVPKNGTPKTGTPKNGVPKNGVPLPQEKDTPTPKNGAPLPQKLGHTNYLYSPLSLSLSSEETVEPTERARSSGNQSSEAGEALASDTSRLWDEWMSQPPPPDQPPQELTEEEKGRQLAAELTRPAFADLPDEIERFHARIREKRARIAERMRMSK